jgi:putative oxidoreductase
MLSVLRVIVGLVFLAHGTQKILGFPASPMNPAMFSLPWIAGVIELVGGTMFILGLFTRPVAFILSGEMAFAYWMAHAPRSSFPALNGGDAAILFCFIFLYFVFSGPGRFSLDGLMNRRGRETRDFETSQAV